MHTRHQLTIVAAALLLTIFAAGCKKKTPPPTPPPPPPPIADVPVVKPAAPLVAQFTAEPTSIEKGQSSTLRWQVSGDVTSVAIDNGIGAVQNTGNRRVYPSGTTSYTLTATGGGGTSTGSVTITVNEPPPPPPPPPPPAAKMSIEQRISTELQDAFFDYDKNDIRSDAQAVLSQDATAMKSILADFPNASIVVEGHCDERGSAEYNLALGDRRASSAKDYLTQLGVPADRLKTISYGKERPQCTEATEECWQKNRRAHFAPAQ